MRLVAVDPGTKPGVVELDGSGAVVRASHRLEDWLWSTEWDVAVTELQWFFGNNKRTVNRRGQTGTRDVNVNDLFKLAFRAGFTLACIPAGRSLALSPQVWRAPYGNLSKEQVQKKIATQLTAAEKRVFIQIPASRHGDVLDAIGIGRAALRILHTTKYDYKL